MATRLQFASTWWAQAWIHTFDTMADLNRLSRGRSYAVNGRVINLKFTQQKQHVFIEANVFGSYGYVYDTQIIIDPIPKEKANALVAAIAKNLDIISALMEHELPEEILPLCESFGINLFPEWTYRNFRCSCPDEAELCKHTAAVLYLVAQRLNTDPLLLFSLRGIHLAKALAQLGINLNNTFEVRPLSPEKLLQRATAELDSTPTNALEAEDSATIVDPEAYALRLLRTLPYATLPELADTIATLLPESMPLSNTNKFSPRAFMLKLQKLLQRRIRSFIYEPYNAYENGTAQDCLKALLTHQLGGRQPSDTLASAVLQSAMRPALDLLEGGVDATVALYRTEAIRTKQKNTLSASFEPKHFFSALLMMDSATAQQLPPIYECWYGITLAAAHLLMRGDFILTAIRSEKIYNAAPRVWWVPALRDPKVRDLVTRLTCGITPWAEQLVEREAKTLCENSPERITILALSAAAAGFVKLTADLEAKKLPPSNIFDCGVLCEDLSSLDGHVPPKVGDYVALALKTLALGEAYPWQPVLTVRTAPDRSIRLNFGILGRKPQPSATAQPETATEALDIEALPEETLSTSAELPTKRPVLLKALLAEERWVKHRFAAISVLRTLSGVCPLLAGIYTSKGKPVALSTSELREFLFETAPHLTMLGVTVMLPQSLRRILRPSLSATAGAGQGFAKSLLTKDAIADFDWQVAIGEHKLTKEEFLALAAHAGDVVPFKDNFVYLDPDEIAKIRKTLEKPPHLTPLERMRAVLMGEIEGTPLEVSEDLKNALARITEVKDVPPPEGLHATLRPYQERGFSWLMKNLSLGMGALIADDMGLGKTLQVIATILELKNRGELTKRRVLAVVPTTLIANWTRELARFAPSVTVGIYHGTNRSLPAPADYPDVILTSYGTLRRDFELLMDLRWRLLVLDEAQAIKNVSTSQTAAVRGVRADAVIAMSGTPVENRLMEYWSILSAVQPRILGSQKEFIETFVKPIESDHDAHAAEAFRRLTAPFMLRRVKTDKSIISDLPEKNTIDHYATMPPAQAALYAATLEKLMKRLRKTEAETDTSTPEGRMARRGVVLQMITSLKQICNSPSQYQHVTVPKPDSGKADALLDILAQCREADRKVLIFTQYREMGERLQEWIGTMMSERPEFLHGGVSLKERTRMVDRFQEDRSARILILSLKAGGTGLNLTAASAVIHYDLWWNPAVEAQATDRAFRIGQRRDVLVFRLITAGSFEERINDMLEQKRGLAELTVTTGESWIGDLPADELERIFTYEHS